MRRVVVVGSSVAGVNAVDGLRTSGYQGEVVLVSGEHELPYDRPPLSKQALAGGIDDDAIRLKPAQWYADRGVDLQLGAPAVGLDSRDRKVMVAGSQTLGYDGLVIATGCTPRPLSTGSDGTIFTLRTIADCQEIHKRLEAGRRLVVIGAGFIGLEVAAVAHSAGMDVTVVEAADVPLTRVVGRQAGEWFRDFHVVRGIDLRCGTTVAGITTQADGRHTLELADGTKLPADLIVAGVGVTPSSGWLRGSDVAVHDGVLCDSSLATTAPGVVAAGDIARWKHPLFDEEMRVEQWLNAVEQGAHAARTLLGHREPFASIPYFWSDQFEAKVRFVGHARGADQVLVKPLGDASMATLFGRDGTVSAAMCVNSPRLLATFRRAIADRLPWAEAVDAIS